MKPPLQRIQLFLNQKNYSYPWVEMPIPVPDLIPTVSHLETVKKGKTLFYQENESSHCYIVNGGRFRVHFMDSSGTENCVFIAQKGCLLGEHTALNHTPNCFGATAIVTSTVYAFSNQSFKRILNSCPSISSYLVQNFILRERIFTSKLEYYNKSALAKTALSLLSLCVEYGVPHPEGIRIGIRFTHEELGNLTGHNRVTISKIYQKLRNKQIIRSENGFVVVKDPESLMCLIESESL